MSWAWSSEGQILELAGGCSAFCVPHHAQGHTCALAATLSLPSQRCWLEEDLCLTVGARKPGVAGTVRGSGDFLDNCLLRVQGGSALHASDHRGQGTGEEVSFLQSWVACWAARGSWPVPCAFKPAGRHVPGPAATPPAGECGPAQCSWRRSS